MAGLLEKINFDLKEAMRNKEAALVSCLRMLWAAIQNKEISLRGGEKAELDDSMVEEVVRSEIKKRKDAAASYEQGNRADLAAKEKEEIAVYERYLPAGADAAEIERIVSEVIAAHPDAAPKDFGRLMGEAMGKLKGRAEGGAVSEALKRRLNG